ncbi:acyl carrier protein [Streptomyces sp. HNM0574]|uniref:acyl carrier protein n=1 Tax=Streptomyces sp. HNM0574 TaxID=2714954 RepID=UPI00146C305A|nr:acyl carrier protein [Streptomyces sp. HNM0574]NLU68559.1 acyl carrier protein [Streptomyces sp. HNM0574]
MTATTVPQGRAPARSALLAQDIDARIRGIETFVAGELTRLLEVPSAHRVDTSRPLHTQGVGSILGLHLKQLLQLSFGVDIGVVTVLDDSVAELAAKVALRLEDEPGTDGTPLAAATVREEAGSAHLGGHR